MIRQPETPYRLGRPHGPPSDAAAPSDPEPQPPVPQEPAGEPALPPGWTCLRDADLSGRPEDPVRVPLVLLHPEFGVALVDLAPQVTERAEAALRERLEASRFGAIFGGVLPILHLSLTPQDLEELDQILPRGFATLPPLSVPGGEGWVSVVRRALSTRAPAPVRAAVLAEAAEAPRRAATFRPARGLPPPAEGQAVTAAAAGKRRPWRRIALASVAALAVGGALALVGRPAPRPSMPAPAPGIQAGTALPAQPQPPVEGSGATAPSRPPAAPAAPRRDAAAPPPAAGAAPAGSSAGPQRPAAPLPPPAAGAPAASPAGTQDSLPRVAVRSPANMRTSPNTNAPVIRTAPRGEAFRIFGEAPGGWAQVGDTEPRGWIYRPLLQDLP